MNKNIIPIHNFSVDNESSEPFRIITLQTRTDYDTSVPHRHNYYEIFLFEKGGGIHEIDFNTFSIKDKSIHFVSPGQVHKVKREPDSCGYIILFSRDFFYANNRDKNSLFEIPFLNNNYIEPIINFNATDYQRIVSLVREMDLEYKERQDYAKDAIQSYLNLLLLNCKRLFNDTIGETEMHNDTFQNFRRLLENEFDKNHQVGDYASKLGVSDKQLSIITKDAVGKKALEMIHNRIMLEAKRLLKYSDHSIKEIAFFLNFDDPSHFGKFFKAKEGLTPSEFRSMSH